MASGLSCASELRSDGVVLLLGLALLCGCGQGAASEAAGKLRITVSILPQGYFVERIGGEYVDLSVMVLPGESPATYEPKPEQLKALGEADGYVGIGVPFTVTGLWLSYFLNLTSGATIILVSGLAYLISMAVSRLTRRARPGGLSGRV